MTDLQEWLEAANPIMETDEDPASVPPFESIWRAVQESEPVRPRRRSAWIVVSASPWRRVALGGVVVATVAAVAFAAVNLLPASGTPGAVSDAAAKQIIARAAAVLSGTGSGILHIAETLTVNPNESGQPINTSTVESWDSETAPLAYWSTAVGNDGAFGKTVIANDTIEHYDSSSNTIQELRNAPPIDESWQQFADEHTYFGPVVSLLGQQDPGAVRRLVFAGSQAPATFPAEFSHLVEELLSAPGVTVNSAASVNGAPAITITNNNVGYTLYVQPGTYTPLEITYTAAGRDPTTLTITFTAWETLPPGSVPIPDLTQLYPKASVVPMSTNGAP